MLDWLFKKKEVCAKKEFNNSYYQFQLERDLENNKTAQIFEDKRVEREIRNIALDMHQKWCVAPIIKIGDKEFKNCILIPDMRRISFYSISHRETAKFSDKDIHQLVKDEFNKLKNDRTRLF